MSDLALYNKTVREWQLKYGVTRKSLDLNPTHSSLHCEACGNGTRKITRHHKGDDYFYAIYKPDDFAPRYIMFLEEDIVRLCSRCHNFVHKRILDPIRVIFKQEIIIRMGEVSKKQGINPSDFTSKEQYYGFQSQHVVTKELCQEFIDRSRRATDQWLELKRKKHAKRAERKGSRVHEESDPERSSKERGSINLADRTFLRKRSS